MDITKLVSPKQYSGPVGSNWSLLHQLSNHYVYLYYARELLLIQAIEASYLHTLQAL
jgi:hypothetical protein